MTQILLRNYPAKFYSPYTIFISMYITVDVKPSQREESIDKIDEEHLIVHVKAPASKGKANKAVIKLLKNHFGRQVFLVSGHTSSRKVFEVEE